MPALLFQCSTYDRTDGSGRMDIAVDEITAHESVEEARKRAAEDVAEFGQDAGIHLVVDGVHALIASINITHLAPKDDSEDEDPTGWIGGLG